MLLKGKTQAEVDSELLRAAKDNEVKGLSEYLSATDWYVIRAIENGKKVPDDVALARQNARDRISGLKAP